MEGDLRSFALKSTLDEIRNLCPDISGAFMFSEDGGITASDENTPEKSMVRIVDALDGLLEKAETMGGIELVTIEGSKGVASLSHLGNQYLVTVTNEEADKNVNLMTRSIVTTVLKLLEKISPAPLQTNPSGVNTDSKELMMDEEEREEQPPTKPEIEESERAEKTVRPETEQSQLTANQFMVENTQGMLVAADTVRVDGETLLQWEEHENHKIKLVEVETFGGQSTRCKIKPIKDSKLIGKGVIQVPQKIQRLLDIKKGELVKVKPSVKQEDEGP
jgi:predicted regulator of Ras-like GTPase activity (Roadblock/LC7/MglB family)